MIQTNLSTRPFYNERAVHLWLTLIAVVAVGLTVFNATRIAQYSRRDTRLSSQATRDEARAAELHANAVRLRGTVDAKQVESASVEARQANDLIDRRTFSWTELFNRFETTLPPDVRITAVRPKVDRRDGTVITIVVVAKGTDDVEQFMENLEGTGAFKDLRGTSEEHYNEQGLLEATIETRYKPVDTRPATGEKAR